VIFATTPPPLADTLEVSVFGTGNGESLAVHLGEGQWMLVDSCMGKSSSLPLSLEYLKSLEVDLNKDVKLIVATHWHDDHVRGLSKLVDHCSSAELVFSQALEFDEFRKVFGLFKEHHSFDQDKSGVKEMASCLDILFSRKINKVVNYLPPVRTQSDHRIFRCQLRDCEVWSLSPSPLSIENSHQEIKKIWSSLVQESKGGNGSRPPRAAIPKPHRNHNAVALWVKCGDRKVLLGADLEECGNPALGWQAVLSCKVFPDGQASIYKIPHHGSPNGDHEPIWSQIILSGNSFACVTAYNKGVTPRPAPEDISRILKHTNNLHYTSLPPKTASNRYGQTVERTIVGVTKRRKALKCNPGHVQMRWDIAGNLSVSHGGSAGMAKS
jgi:hypothetical protein